MVRLPISCISLVNSASRHSNWHSECKNGAWLRSSERSYGDATTGRKIAAAPPGVGGVGEPAVGVVSGVVSGVGIGELVGSGVAVGCGAASNAIWLSWVVNGDAAPSELAKLETVVLNGVVIPTAAVPVAIQETSTSISGALADADTPDNVARLKRTASAMPSPLLSYVRLHNPTEKAARLSRQCTGARTVLLYPSSAVTAPRLTTLLTLTASVTLIPPNGKTPLAARTKAGAVCSAASGALIPCAGAENKLMCKANARNNTAAIEIAPSPQMLCSRAA